MFPNQHPTVIHIPSSLNTHDTFSIFNTIRSSLPFKWFPPLVGIKWPTLDHVPLGLDEESRTSDMEEEVDSKGIHHPYPLYVGSSEEEGVEQLYGFLAGFSSRSRTIPTFSMEQSQRFVVLHYMMILLPSR